MIGASFVKKIFGSRNDRVVRQLSKTVAQINNLEPVYEKLSDAEIHAKTDEFRRRFQQGETLDSLLPEAFALVREASKRTLKLRHFDVQLIGGMVLHQGKIAEMGTGEGKTLVATLAAYLNSLSGKGVHIVTVNDYLAKRDAEWMQPIYNMLGLTVGINLSNMPQTEKRDAYAADITYGTNNEFGFDYLRDNMVFNLQDRVLRGLNYAVVDEVDSILIDEARTPLIISGPSEDSTELYTRINHLIPQLKKQETETSTEGDYFVDEKTRQAYLTEAGHERVEAILEKEGLLQPGESLYASSNIILMHHLIACIRAHALYQRDVHYIVSNKEVVIVDEHTGRTMVGRRWSDGLHQAVEAKEGVPIQGENQTMASITFQNYFRMYNKLAGMTGTADTEAYEFQHIYGLEVIVIPTNKPIVRKDFSDQIYLTQREKFQAVIEDIKACRERQQPVLVGTASIETSEHLSSLLKKEKIPHQVLNAKQHEKEANIIVEAGRPGAVTIATNMAGRGTDIVLGGNLAAEIKALSEPSAKLGAEPTMPPDAATIAALEADWAERHKQVLAAGGLHVIGSERHEARRIDNQLRGRSGRQGDPGSTRFYLSLQDNLLRIFASDRVAMIMQKLGMKEGEPIEHPWVTKAIENAQRKVEGHNFDIRKQLLEYDDVANEQRNVIYEQRDDLLMSDDISATITEIRHEAFKRMIEVSIPPGSLEEQWDVESLEKQLDADMTLKYPIKQWLDTDETLDEETLQAKIIKEAESAYQGKYANLDQGGVRILEKSVMLQTLDNYWREHLAAMDYLRQGIYLRGYAQKNPKQEYKREAFLLFTSMLDKIKHDTVSMLYKVQIQSEPNMSVVEQRRRDAITNMNYEHAAAGGIAQETAYAELSDEQDSSVVTPFVRQQPKVGRNDPCFCGSGKKYKNCHGQIAD